MINRLRRNAPALLLVLAIVSGCGTQDVALKPGASPIVLHPIATVDGIQVEILRCASTGSDYVQVNSRFTNTTDIARSVFVDYEIYDGGVLVDKINFFSPRIGAGVEGELKAYGHSVGARTSVTYACGISRVETGKPVA